jgi:hypothetical protein
MAEIAKGLETEFSTADAYIIRSVYDDDVLTLSFKDWQENVITVKFHDVAGFKWQEAYSLGPEDRDDCTYIIENSNWLKLILDQGGREPSEGHQHFKLGFNAIGVFEVIAVGMEKI